MTAAIGQKVTRTFKDFEDPGYLKRGGKILVKVNAIGTITYIGPGYANVVIDRRATQVRLNRNGTIDRRRSYFDFYYFREWTEADDTWIKLHRPGQDDKESV